MDDTIDLLQIKIEKARAQLSNDTLSAIDAVNWKAVILAMRETRGYSFEQLGNLEIETELVLCGLLDPKNYPKEIENRMKISQTAANELVEEMNKLVFAKIREELIKITERKKGEEKPVASIDAPEIKPIFHDTEEEKKSNAQILSFHGIEILNENDKKPTQTMVQSGGETLPVPEKLEIPVEKAVHPILVQKLSGSFQMPSVKTEHSLENMTKANQTSTASKPSIDPYREIPE